MNASLTSNLALIGEAPKGTQKLRELILELAVRGKLVHQDPSDSPARLLLDEIKVKRTLKAGTSAPRPLKPFPAIEPEEIPYELPDGWLWVRLGTIGKIFNGDSISASEKESKFKGVDGRPYIATKDVGYGLARLDYENGVSIPEGDTKFKVAHAGAVLICAEGGSAGKKCGLVEKDVCFGNKLFANEVYGGIPSRLMLYIYLSSTFRQSFEAAMTGIIGGVSIAKFSHLLVPLPPLPEQHRIVAKVDEMMAMCERLESQQAEAQHAHIELVKALIDSLTRAEDSIQFDASVRRLSEHFDTLFTTDSSIEMLKQALLQLAVTGKLIPQDPRDESAKTHYGRQRPLPRGYVRSGKQRITGTSAGGEDLLPNIPASWTYRSVDDLYKSGHISDYADGNHGSFYPRKEEFSDEGVIFLTAAQISENGTIQWSDCPRLTAAKANQLTKGWSQLGDVLYTHNATVGRTAIAKDGPENLFLLGTSVTFYRVNGEGISPAYLYWYLSSSTWSGQAELVMRQTTRNQVSITKQALFYVALPPRAEQDRIVARLNELMSLCDELKARLGQAQHVHRQLADVLAEHAVV